MSSKKAVLTILKLFGITQMGGSEPLTLPLYHRIWFFLKSNYLSFHHKKRQHKLKLVILQQNVQDIIGSAINQNILDLTN